MTSPDPTRSSHFKQLFDVLADMDAAITEVYRARGEGEVRARFILPLVRLAHLGPMTITELARELERTHSALSQTVAQMRQAGLVGSEPGEDGRTRVITLTEHGRALVPLAEAEWRATEAAIAELDAEIPYAATQVAADLASALGRRSFAERLADRLDDAEPGSAGAG
ncbi:transcriptional regulator, MarR family [Serinicoccus hydrothermalis]|uniref:Transcriptional regulator, MarR family n=1 Tax=Serinicoccus hydrothermalis TaxID=1758689 RepID=A0A1B1NDC0_9MICO|nr:MarR family transcriptional regulator [Serinicoccus hydrothermalis]ANS79450.1 transcriptional regulator, MarR family [Serinicoccus hydrothermalis]